MKTVICGLKIRDTEKISWSKSLASYLKKTYGSPTWHEFYDQQLAEKLDHIRNNANGELAAESLLEQSLIYYAYLEHLYLRTGNSSSLLRLDFNWYDAEYDSNKGKEKFAQHTLAFERSSMLYNIGAILSEIAQEKMAQDGKMAIAYLSKAYGCFEFLSENFLNSPSADLQADNTRFLADLCHAEAQELFLLALINGTDAFKKASLISKLALLASTLYEKLNKFYLDTTTVIGVRFGDLKWKSIIACKAHFYRSVCAYNYGLFLEQQNKVGEAISFMKIASESIVSALPNKLYVKDEMSLDAFKTLIDGKTKSLIKDNDYIYHDSIPIDSSVQAIKPMDAVKPIEISKQLAKYLESCSESSAVLFKGIVPMEIYEKESIYSEDKAQALRLELEKVSTADWELTSFIDFTNLQKMIQELKSRIQNCNAGGQQEDVQYAMGKKNLEFWSESVNKSHFRDIDLQMKAIVKKRQTIMNKLGSLPPGYRDNAVKLKSSLISASKSDDKLFSSLKPYAVDIKLLEDRTSLLQQWDAYKNTNDNHVSLLDIDDGRNEQAFNKLKHVELQYNNLKLLKEERTRNAEDLKRALNNDDITDSLLKNRNKTDSELRALFQEELSKFDPLRTRIEAAIFKQSDIINDIKISLSEIFNLTGIQEEGSNTDPKKSEREEFLTRMDRAFASFSTFSLDLPKGLEFYDSLLKITNELAESSEETKPPTNIENPSSPALPRNPGNSGVEERLGRLHLTNNYESRSPPIPSRDQYGFSPDYSMAIPGGPPLPPRQPASGITTLLSQNQNEERELEENPTSFYSRPSVFDENLYSKFSQ
ncbi:LAMI_0E07580g1_1 [Lachancea mirantina]|uniref:BRO domain-containing protein 1 n=1 Tax=Lachancea mirantina TaxID=1230905 RepID=A0A1G4JMI4_9SACH|nr:LAMI_0E07580g1_1 [Lachancea mirantina]